MKRKLTFMNEAQALLTHLHDVEGFSDGKLAEILEVSREYVLRVRHGKKNASQALLADIKMLAEYIASEGNTEKIRSKNVTPASTENEEIADESVITPNDSLVFVGVAVLVIGAIAVAVWRSFAAK